MIDSLQGLLAEGADDFAIVDVRGIRFRCEVPLSTTRSLPAIGAECVLLTRLSLNVNEGTFQLFGFASAAERDCFDLLNSISGIGPRKAITMLSHLDVPGFASAVLRGDTAYLSKVKGIGKKMAERLVLELREKVGALASAEGAGPAPSLHPPNIADAIQALMVLGAKQPVAERAVQEAVTILGADAPTEALIREGLRHR